VCQINVVQRFYKALYTPVYNTTGLIGITAQIIGFCTGTTPSILACNKISLDSLFMRRMQIRLPADDLACVTIAK